MNHYGIGRLSRDASIRLPVDLLRPLSIENDVDVWGMYYPSTCLEDEARYRDRIDFMFSPLPYELWPVSARLTVHTKHVKHAFTAVSGYLAENGVSILLSEASRSGHRYDTWSMIVAFDRAAGENLGDYEPSLKGFSSVLSLIEQFREDFPRSCKDVLHIEEADAVLGSHCSISPVQSMAYFYHLSKTSPKVGQEKHAHQHKPFKLKCNARNELSSDEFRSIAHIINRKFDKILGCPIFAESQPADMNIRAVFIPESKRGFHFGATFRFLRHGLPNTSIGFTHYILKNLPEQLRVVAINNQSLLFTDLGESGRIHLVMRDLKHRRDAERKLELERCILEPGLPPHLEAIDSVEIDTYPLPVLERMQEYEREEPAKKRNDLFISYAREDEAIANKLIAILQERGVTVFYDRHLSDGDIFTDALRTGLIQSKEILLICSPSSKQSQWVFREYSAAWALGMTVNIVTHRMSRKDLPSAFSQIHATPYDEILDRPDEWKLIRRFTGL